MDENNKETEVKENILRNKSFNFAIRIINLYKYLCNDKKEYNLSKQILRSGTSIGANIEESLGGISINNFSNKISIAYKESRETEYWLRLLNETKYLEEKLFNSLYTDCVELSKILYSILKKTRIKKT